MNKLYIKVKSAVLRKKNNHAKWSPIKKKQIFQKLSNPFKCILTLISSRKEQCLFVGNKITKTSNTSWKKVTIAQYISLHPYWEKSKIIINWNAFSHVSIRTSTFLKSQNTFETWRQGNSLPMISYIHWYTTLSLCWTYNLYTFLFFTWKRNNFLM